MLFSWCGLGTGTLPATRSPLRVESGRPATFPHPVAWPMQQRGRGLIGRGWSVRQSRGLCWASPLRWQGALLELGAAHRRRERPLRYAGPIDQSCPIILTARREDAPLLCFLPASSLPSPSLAPLLPRLLPNSAPTLPLPFFPSRSSLRNDSAD